jgi:hypothetical protein
MRVWIVTSSGYARDHLPSSEIKVTVYETALYLFMYYFSDAINISQYSIPLSFLHLLSLHFFWTGKLHQ